MQCGNRLALAQASGVGRQHEVLHVDQTRCLIKGTDLNLRIERARSQNPVGCGISMRQTTAHRSTIAY